MARRVNVEIKLESGKTLSHYHWLKISQVLSAHNTFELAVPFEMLEEKEETFFSRSHQDVCGKAITVSFSPVSGSGSFDFRFKGVVTEITLNHTGSLANGFVLKGYSPTILLEDSRQRRIFLKQSLEQIVNKVLNPYPSNLLKCQMKPEFGDELRYVAQYDESNFQFLNRLAAQYGEWLYYNGRELLMGRPEDNQAVDFKVDGIQTFNLAVALHPLQFQLHRYNYLKHESYTNHSDSQSVAGLNTFGDFASRESGQLFGQVSGLLADRDVQEKSELDGIIKRLKSGQANQLVTFQGSGETPNLTLGTSISVSGSRPGSQEREEYGKYRIIEIRHEINSNGNYQNYFRAVPDKTEYPPLRSEWGPPKGYSEVAEVTDNQDPENLGRVRVRFFWPASDDDAESDWLRVALPYTGEGSGMLFVPEVKAQVLVGYEGGLAELPIVIGSLYHQHSGDPPDEGYTYRDNSLKAIRTKGGNQMLLQDKEGEKTIVMGNTKQDKAKITLSFEGDGKIIIETNGELSFKAKDISIEAQHTLKIKAQSIEMKAMEKIEAKATQLKLQADASAEIAAQATLELSGQASAKISGAMVDVSGQAMVNVAAALVKIN
jgi:uncharacterized protein involved in type VI secretion and phage assembly